MQETWVRSLGWEDPLEEGMATYSNVLAWRIPWTEEPDRSQSMWSQRVGHNWATELNWMITEDFPGGSDDKESAWNAGDLGSIPGLGRSLGGGHGNPLQCFCLENPRNRRAWWATVHGVGKNQTKWLRTQWWVMLSIFSCAYRSSIYIPGINVYSDNLTYFNWIICWVTLFFMFKIEW